MELFPQASEKLARWRFTGDFGKHFSTIFDLQMWCLGCDIRRAEGNLLLHYGFERRRPEEGVPGSSHYFKQIDPSHQIHLWGFAMIVTNPLCGLCLKRHERIPVFAWVPNVAPHLSKPHDLPPFSSPKTDDERVEARGLLSRCVAEMSQYENLVESVEMPLYRSQCLKGQRSGKKLRGLSLRSAWGELQHKLEATEDVNRD
jgi:hypothetical protein